MDSEGTYRQLPAAARTRWRVANVIGGVIGGGVLGIAPTLVVALALDQPIGWAIAPTLMLCLALLGLWFANRRHERFGYLMTGDFLRVRDGVVIHTDAIAPFYRVQHVDITRGPLQLQFGLATLTIHTAAPAADITLPDLRANDAEQVRDEILAASRRAAEELGVADVDAV